MYHTIKKIVSLVVPKQVLIANEIALRSIFAFNLRGKNHQCTICCNKLKNFILLDTTDLLCPFCGSRARTRRLQNMLTENKLLNGNVLHFSPSRSLFRLLKKEPNISYFSTDFEDEFLAEYQYDITKIPVEDKFFDLIICYHILEHITEDEKAMSELLRVLKPNGICLLQTPFKAGEIYEDKNIKTEAERVLAFGQKDHVRVYSVNGIVERLKNAGFDDIEAKAFDKDNYFGLVDETVIFAKK